MKAVIRRVVRKAAGLPPLATRVPTVAEIERLSERLDAMDKGLQDLMHANRTEMQRALRRMRSEIDALRDGHDPLE